MPNKATFQPDLLDENQFYIFSLPQELLTALVPLEDQKVGQTVDDVAAYYQIQQLNENNLEKLNKQQNEMKTTNNNNEEETFSCSTCQQIFINREQQRDHFSTDWHRYNIKRKVLFEQSPVSLSEFEDLLQGI